MHIDPSGMLFRGGNGLTMQIILLVIEPQLVVFVVLLDVIPTITLDSPQ